MVARSPHLKAATVPSGSSLKSFRRVLLVEEIHSPIKCSVAFADDQSGPVGGLIHMLSAGLFELGVGTPDNLVLLAEISLPH